MMTITVVNVKKFKGKFEYCGRNNNAYVLVGSPLANPYVLRKESDRAIILAKYQRWFDSEVKGGNVLVCDELARLISLARAGDLNLGCYCAPKACHCDVIKSFIESHI